MRLTPSTDTVPASVNRYLLPWELQVITVHFHPAALFGPVGVVVAGLVAAAVGSSLSAFSSAALLIIWLVWGLLFLYAIGKVLSWSVDYFVVTSQRLVVAKGLLARDVASASIAKVATMRFRRSVMGRVLGYGQLIFDLGPGQPTWTVNFMPYPEQLYLEISGLIYPDSAQSQDAAADPEPAWLPAADLDARLTEALEGLPSQPQPRGSWRTEQPGDEVDPEHDGRNEDEERGP